MACRETAAFQVITTTSGKKYFFGNPLDDQLAGSQSSVWVLCTGAAQHLGCGSLPDLAEMFEHVAKLLGSNEFGIPRIPENHKPHDKPLGYVKVLWPALLPIAELFCRTVAQWPVLYSFAIQERMSDGKDLMEPRARAQNRYGKRNFDVQYRFGEFLSRSTRGTCRFRCRFVFLSAIG